MNNADFIRAMFGVEPSPDTLELIRRHQANALGDSAARAILHANLNLKDTTHYFDVGEDADDAVNE